MRRMQRYSKWIALIVVLALAMPFLAQGLGALLSVDPIYVASALLLVTLTVIAILARPKDHQGR